MDQVVILTGFMGAGKSATGRELARLLGWEFVDLDREIEVEAGRSVAEIFAAEGEAGFRDREAAALKRVLCRPRVVLAAGGGALLREENRRRLEGRPVVNLDTPLAECLRRVRRSKVRRPLLEGPGGEAAARRLWETRRPVYESVPCQVPTAGRSPAQVAREIERRLRKRAPGAVDDP